MARASQQEAVINGCRNRLRETDLKKLLITGANGKLGTRLILHLANQFDIRAIVRSERAKESLQRSVDSVDIRIVDYNDESALAMAAAECDHAVHLVGIIRQTANSRYQSAHEDSCSTLVSATEKAGLKSIVYLSLIGSDSNSGNPCFSSRGKAEEILRSAGIPVVIIRVPMVLGEDDYASLSLAKKANARYVPVFRADSSEQPIYAGDVIEAIVQSLDIDRTETIELAGPESLSRQSLILRAAELLGHHPVVINLPLGCGLLLAGVLEVVSKNPPVTRDMLNVLDHDDDIDAISAARRLGITLTSLDDMLKAVIRNNG